MPEADHAHASALERGRTKGALTRGADRRFDTECGERARVAGATPPAGEAGDVARPLGDDVHVAARGADILGGDVAALHRVDRVGEIKQGVVTAPRRQVVTGPDHDHALAAAEREVGDRRLVCHRSRQPERIAQRRPRVAVLPHPAAAERRATSRRVDGDDRQHPGPAAAAQQHLLVVELLEIALDPRRSPAGDH